MAVRTSVLVTLIAAVSATLVGCAAEPASAPAAQRPAASILVSSIPAAGSTVQGPVNELTLRFNPPARLDEVTVSGPQGLMPIMVTSVAEAADYSLPVHGLGAGQYSIKWTATSAGREYSGSFGFTVK